jgi:cytidyltransferase-like protein
MTSNKIVSLGDLVALLEGKRADKKRIVHCHGVFDLLHVGHLRHFEQARKLGDVLVVTLTPDCYVNKGAGRPAFTQDLRAEFVAALECIDYVAINAWPSAVPTIHQLRPHVFVKGSEFRNLNDTIGHVSQEGEAIRAVGGEIAFTEDIIFSSSGLINRYLSQFPEHVRDYLSDFANRHSIDSVLCSLRAAAGLRVLVVGEVILDEYAYCEAIGKSGKEPTLVARYKNTDRFGGGVLACANHAAGFCNSVDVLSFLGEDGDQETFVRSCLKSNVNPLFVYKKGSPTIVKKRFVEQYFGQKLFELYTMNDESLAPAEDQEFCSLLGDVLPSYDVVIVADYGHGLLSPQAIRLLCSRSRFLAVNTQSNAGNHGFNLISKYPRADYVCLAHREVALETRDLRLAPEAMVRHVASRLSCPRMLMTRGKDGCMAYIAPDTFFHVPALATQVVDRVGAGDSVLCVTSLAAAMGEAGEVLGFIGNVVGAEAVAIMGNQRSVERIPLYRHIESLLKTHKRGQTPVDGTTEWSSAVGKAAA